MSPRDGDAPPPRRQNEHGECVIRVAASEDLQSLVALRIDFYRTQLAAGWLDLPNDLDGAMKQGTPGIIRAPRNCVFLAEIEGALAGYVFGTTKIVPGVRNSSIASIEEIYVAPRQRGTGLARRLFETALADFNTRGADRVQLRVLAANAAGRTFWSGLGFRENVVICELEQSRRE
jgi:ribosomal protein S18 acetylase RimI-like enzyme